MAALRRTLRSHAWLALAAFLCGWTLPFAEAHPLGQDDAACQASAVSHDSVPSTISTAADQEQPAHCAICHLMRTMNGAVPVDVGTLAVFFASIPQPAPSSEAPPTVASAPPSSRGPPASL